MKKTRLYLSKPIDTAIEMVTKEMGAQLRRAAITEGWSMDDAATMVIDREPDKLSPKTRIQKFAAKYEETDATFKAEYGEPGVSPRATVRRFMGNSKPWERRTAKLIERKAFK